MTAVSAGPGKSASQIYFYDWSDNYRRVIKELKAAEAQKVRSGSVSSFSNISSHSSLDSCEFRAGFSPNNHHIPLCSQLPS